MRRAAKASTGQRRNDPHEDRRAALTLIGVSRETEARLGRYVALLERWQAVKNLVGPSTLPHVWTRHIADSAQLLPLAPEARRWIDMGAGAGFPGLVVAILLQGRTGAMVHLIESNSRKCAFLREVVRELDCPATIHDERIENVVATLGDVDIVTARALAPLPVLIEMGKIPLSGGASGMFLKSAAEIDALAMHERGSDWAVVPSLTSPEGRIVMTGPLASSRGELRS